MVKVLKLQSFLWKVWSSHLDQMGQLGGKERWCGGISACWMSQVTSNSGHLSFWLSLMNAHHLTFHSQGSDRWKIWDNNNNHYSMKAPGWRTVLHCIISRTWLYLKVGYTWNVSPWEHLSLICELIDAGCRRFRHIRNQGKEWLEGCESDVGLSLTSPSSSSASCHIRWQVWRWHDLSLIPRQEKIYRWQRW